jgi:hypothetical protein
MKRIICIICAALAISGCTASQSGSTVATRSPVHHTDALNLWKLKWQTTFSESAKLGSFSDCNHNDRTSQAYCSGLPEGLRSQWWAYPYPWPDTATENHKPLGGYYDPMDTVWIRDNQMHVRMFRTTAWIHSAALLPKAAIDMMYGKYVERFSVSPDPPPGYKSAHMLWAASAPIGAEVDFPEGPWDSSICAYVHSIYETGQLSFCTHVKFTGWHTSEIEWMPGILKFYLDGKEIGTATGKWVPEQPMSWILQNESALGVEEATDYSSAQLNIASVAVYSYQGHRSL